jgi:biopolymer transport protein ExbB
MNTTNGRTNHRFFQIASCLAVAVVVCMAPNLVFGQADMADAAVDEVATGGGGSKSLFGVIREGGVMMVPLLVCSFITLVFVFEKFISLRRGRVIPSPFVKRFLHQLREGKLDKESALELCHDDGSPVSEVFASGVRRWGRPTVEIEQAILDAEERSAVGLRRYLRIFSVTANISPLLGLLGTVLGMIRLFGEIADADAMGRVERLAGGISEALLTTASGLCVAIPALCFYVFFSSRVERLLGDVDLLGQELVGLISAEGLAEAKTSKTSRRSTAA